MLMEVDDDEIYIGDKGNIPAEVISLLPNSQVSVLRLLQHPLPPSVAHGFAPSSTSPFFDNNPPNITDGNVIFTLPIPPAMTVVALDKAFPKAVQNGYQSIKCLHIVSTVGKTYPLWITPLWKIVSCIHAVQQAWATAQDNLLQYGQRRKMANQMRHKLLRRSSMHSVPCPGMKNYKDSAPMRQTASKTSQFIHQLTG
jgi:hypothetical protein